MTATRNIVVEAASGIWNVLFQYARTRTAAMISSGITMSHCKA